MQRLLVLLCLVSGCCLSRRLDTSKLLPLHRGAVYSAGAAASTQGFYK